MGDNRRPLLISLALTLLCYATPSIAQPQNDLARYRHSALEFIVQTRLPEPLALVSPRFRTESRALLSLKDDGIMAWLMVLVQKDNIDFTKASFQIKAKGGGTSQPMTCYLSIREGYEHPDRLYLNLQNCVGVYASQLSGPTEYGLRLLEISKPELQH